MGLHPCLLVPSGGVCGLQQSGLGSGVYLTKGCHCVGTAVVPSPVAQFVLELQDRLLLRSRQHLIQKPPGNVKMKCGASNFIERVEMSSQTTALYIDSGAPNFRF